MGGRGALCHGQSNCVSDGFYVVLCQRHCVSDGFHGVLC